MVVIWSFGAFSFFVVPFYIGTLPLNIYMMSTATAVGEIISSIICLFVTHDRDKRKSISIFMFITSFSSVGLILLLWLYTGSSQVPEAISFLIQYTSVVAVFDLVYVIVPECFPTIFLATSFGICNVVGRAIAVMSPMVARAPNPWPLLILAVYSLICVFLPFGLEPLRSKGPTKHEE
jgi:hypothetical protein